MEKKVNKKGKWVRKNREEDWERGEEEWGA